MKRFLCTMLVFFAIAQLGISQVSLRPQVGVNSPSISDDLAVGDWGSSVGYQFGADLQLGGDLYIQPGLNFQTSKLSISNIGDIEISNINIPVMLGYNMGTEGNTFGFRFFAGPNFALHVNEDIGDAITQIIPDDFKSFRISGVGGAGLDFSILFLDVAYNFGLTNWIEGASIEAKQNVFLINAGIRIGFK
jgi:hypothetical protein